MGDPISIIIPAFNQVEYCRQCIYSIQLNTPPERYRLILVDNGSTDGVSEYFDTIAEATVLHSPKNLGFAGGVNLGMKAAEGHVLLLNSDTIVPQGWLERLSGALESASDIGMVGPMSNCVASGQLIPDLLFDTLAEIDAYAARRAVDFSGKQRETARLVGFCLLIRKEVVRDVGYFDESYGIGNFEDDDYCVRVLRAGYRLIVAEDAFVFHYGGRTFAAMGIDEDDYQQLIRKNRSFFEEKLRPMQEERIDAIYCAGREVRAAYAAMAAGDTAEALRRGVAAIQACPSHAAGHAVLGEVLLLLGEKERARESLRRALQLDADHAAAKAALARLGESF